MLALINLIIRRTRLAFRTPLASPCSSLPPTPTLIRARFSALRGARGPVRPAAQGRGARGRSLDPRPRSRLQRDGRPLTPRAGQAAAPARARRPSHTKGSGSARPLGASLPLPPPGPRPPTRPGRPALRSRGALAGHSPACGGLGPSPPAGV